MTRRHTNRRAFGLLEMLMVLVLLSVFSLISARLFWTMMQAMRRTQEAGTAISRMDAAMRVLRADVWDAREMKKGDGGALLIRRGQEDWITWWTDEDRALVRRMGKTEKGTGAEKSPESRWPEIGERLRFEPGGSMLVVRTDAGAGGPVDEQAFISQVQLLAGGQP